MKQSEIIKESLTSKIIILIVTGLIFLFIFFTLGYKFNNLTINSVILYIFSHIFRFIFSFDVLDIFFDITAPDFELDIDEFKARKFELRLKYPKLYYYNQIILYTSIFIKLVAILMFISGTTSQLIQ